MLILVKGAAVGILGEKFLAIWRERIWRFGEIVFGDFVETWSVNALEIWRKCIRRVRRTHWRFGENVFGMFGERIGDRHVVVYSPKAISETYNG